MQHSLLSFVCVSEKINFCNISCESLIMLLGRQYHSLRSLRDIELYNHVRAIHFIKSISRDEIRVQHLLETHSLLLNRIDDISKGRIRTIHQSECVYGSSVDNIAMDLEELCWRVNSVVGSDLVARMCEVHNRFLEIAPFFDRNYVVARLLIAYVQMKENCDVSLVLQEDIERYRDAARYLHRDTLYEIFAKARPEADIEVPSHAITETDHDIIYPNPAASNTSAQNITQDVSALHSYSSTEIKQCGIEHIADDISMHALDSAISASYDTDIQAIEQCIICPQSSDSNFTGHNITTDVSVPPSDFSSSNAVTNEATASIHNDAPYSAISTTSDTSSASIKQCDRHQNPTVTEISFSASSEPIARVRAKSPDKARLLRFSQLADVAGVKISTLRYWHSLGMIPVRAYTDGGHALFDVTALHQIQRIQFWKRAGLSIEEILRQKYPES